MSYEVKFGKLVKVRKGWYPMPKQVAKQTALPADKGELGGHCNVTSCLAPNANYYNKSTRKHYCERCAREINWEGGRADCMALYGVPLLCEKVDQEEVMHIDDWLDLLPKDENEAMAKEWLEHFRRPAVEKNQGWLDANPLFCTFGNQRFRVIGCSRLGDVWLTRDFRKVNGYDKRIDVMHCSEWSRQP